jgi:hypothetical protein
MPEYHSFSSGDWYMAGHAKIVVLQPGEDEKPGVRTGMIQTLKVSGEEVDGEFALWES